MATGQDSDVIVIGAGIFGLTSAMACLQRGMSVTVLERDTTGSGASGGIVGAMAPHVPDGWSAKKQFQFEALLSAAEYWSGIDAISALSSGYGRIGRLQLIPDAQARDRALRRVAGGHRYWGAQATWSVEDSKDFGLAFPFGVIRDNLSARIHPRNACRSLAAAIRAKGCDIVEGVSASGLHDGSVNTETGTYSAQSIILAAGYETFAFLEPFLGPNSGTGVKGQAMLFRPAQPLDLPMVQTDGLYIVPHADGTVAIGSTSEDHWSRTGTDEKLEALHGNAIAVCRQLGDAEILARWSGIRPKARGRDPMLGRIPGTEHLFVATGGFKTAFGVAHAAGQALAAMVCGEAVNLPPSFTPEYHRVKT